MNTNFKNAPGSFSISGRWTSGENLGIGKSLTANSRVSFTLRHGILNAQPMVIGRQTIGQLTGNRQDRYALCNSFQTYFHTRLSGECITFTFGEIS